MKTVVIVIRNLLKQYLTIFLLVLLLSIQMQPSTSTIRTTQHIQSLNRSKHWYDNARNHVINANPSNQYYIIMNDYTYSLNFAQTQQIPNNLKGYSMSHRSLALIQITKATSFFLSEMVQLPDKYHSVNIYSILGKFHVKTKDIKTKILGDLINMDPSHGIALEYQFVKKNSIKIQSLTNRIMFGIEVIKSEVLWKAHPQGKCFSLPEPDYNQFREKPYRRISHVTNQDIAIVAVNLAYDQYNQLQPIECSIINLNGDTLFYSIISPRQRINNFDSHITGLNESQINNQMDPYEFYQKVTAVLTDKLVVGANLMDTMTAYLKCPLRRIIGLRDLLYHEEVQRKYPMEVINQKELAKKFYETRNLPLRSTMLVQCFHAIYKTISWTDEIILEKTASDKVLKPPHVAKKRRLQLHYDETIEIDGETFFFQDLRYKSISGKIVHHPPSTSE